MKKMIIVYYILAAVLVISGVNYFLWYIDKEDAEIKLIDENSPQDELFFEDNTVDKLNSQVSVKKLRELVLKSDSEISENININDDLSNYSLDKIEQDILSLEQRLDKEF
ncbi:hypothetical protein [Photobacterium rosenbergii]|uniref:Uncharacterized protein n=1 Tax=Photobacterium rosenbergii TaxID=294936 RepID=A0ABU3ZEH4_9GAMM|nr:hypothetical protein [Photobacterium rosenbergii]MDV5168328.1 hypothetical protein [Photobacterium rosenbergii]